MKNKKIFALVAILLVAVFCSIVSYNMGMKNDEKETKEIAEEKFIVLCSMSADSLEQYLVSNDEKAHENAVARIFAADRINEIFNLSHKDDLARLEIIQIQLIAKQYSDEEYKQVIRILREYENGDEQAWASLANFLNRS